jgi:hypothetical protein
MSDDDALGPDMHPLLGFLAVAPPVTVQDILERLLDGRLDPAEAPAGYGQLARLLAAATAPPTPEELVGEQRVLAQFQAVLHPPTLVPRRAPMPSKLLAVKAAAAALVAVLSIGGVAAATGLLPGQAEQAAEQAASTTGAGSAGHGLGKAAVADLDKATHGLCQAWQAGEGTDQGARMDSVAFQALAAAAGGSDNIAGYCADVTVGRAGDQGQGQGAPPSGSPPSTTPSPPSSGPPPDAGPGGHGQGGPPTTTG